MMGCDTVRVFVDGQEGTTGLKINERLAARDDIEVMKIAEPFRKDKNARRKFLNGADVAFLCLPDDAAAEAVAMISNPDTIVIDTSTINRIRDGWVYGLPELSDGQAADIAESKCIANPGCHATGFITLVYPLVKNKVVDAGCPLTCGSITGYSGGGKKMIGEFEIAMANGPVPPMPYSLDLGHKHLHEMRKICGLKEPPIFVPVVGAFLRGMCATVPLPMDYVIGPGSWNAKKIHEMLADYYRGKRFVKVMPFGGEGFLHKGRLDPQQCNDTNNLRIFVFGNDKRALLAAVFDNLGKGASGAAIQNMNIALKLDEARGL